jgi:hypothetical protein
LLNAGDGVRWLFGLLVGCVGGQTKNFAVSRKRLGLYKSALGCEEKNN